ncbi:MAG: hypothetical protein OEZ16_13295, partial [Chromatiales bacterium]|nr:hypothetical protein [Chromatiales bacterium]
VSLLGGGDSGLFPGAAYGRFTSDRDGNRSGLGYLKQGISWYNFEGGASLDTFAAYHFRLRNWDDLWHDAHGPELGLELRKKPFAVGVSHTWRNYLHQTQVDEGTELYLTLSFGWDHMR